jgi:hypothetical protein
MRNPNAGETTVSEPNKLEQCQYCWEWVPRGLHMVVHVEQAHSDLMPLFSGERQTP